MTKFFNLRNVAKMLVTCLAATMMFTACGDDEKEPNDNNNGNNNGNGSNKVVVYLGIDGGGGSIGYEFYPPNAEVNVTGIGWTLALLNSGGNPILDVEWNMDALGAVTYDEEYKVIGGDENSTMIAKIKDWVEFTTDPAGYGSGWNTGASSRLLWDDLGFTELKFVWYTTYGIEGPPDREDGGIATIKSSKLAEIKNYLKYTGNIPNTTIEVRIDEEQGGTYSWGTFE